MPDCFLQGCSEDIVIFRADGGNHFTDYNAKGLKNAEEGKTAPMPKFETSVELLDPMAEVQKESEVEKEKPAENSTDENAALLTKLLSNPETAALLKALAKTI